MEKYANTAHCTHPILFCWYSMLVNPPLGQQTISMRSIQATIVTPPPLALPSRQEPTETRCPVSGCTSELCFRARTYRRFTCCDLRSKRLYCHRGMDVGIGGGHPPRKPRSASIWNMEPASFLRPAGRQTDICTVESRE